MNVFFSRIIDGYLLTGPYQKLKKPWKVVLSHYQILFSPQSAERFIQTYVPFSALSNIVNVARTKYSRFTVSSCRYMYSVHSSSVCILQGYGRISSLTGCHHLRQIRGDNYCAIRAVLFQVLAGKLPVLNLFTATCNKKPKLEKVRRALWFRNAVKCL